MKGNGYIYKFGSVPLLILLACSLLIFAGKNPDEKVSHLYELNNYYSKDYSEILPAIEDLVIVPLKNAGRLYMIEAVIDDVSGNLIFDTGASGLVLNRTYFRKYLKSGEQNSMGITGSVGQAEKVTAGLLNVSGLKFNGISATLSDLSHIENRRGIKVLGLFGFELIRGFEVVIDLKRNELHLYRIDSRGNRKSDILADVKYDISQKIEIYRNIVFLQGLIGGKTLRFCLDTGAETNAVDKRSNSSVLETISIERKSTLTGAGSARAEVMYGKMNDFRIGNQEIRNMTAIITTLDALSEAYGIKTDGMLGYDFLINGPVRINFVKRQLDMQLVKREER